MVGGITLSNVRRGVAQMGSIGYWVGEPFTRKGYTVAAVKAVTRFSFERLGAAPAGGGLHPDQRALAAACCSKPASPRRDWRGLI